eukprot:1137312-Pelagomonas_calceolata.AAC.2
MENCVGRGNSPVSMKERLGKTEKETDGSKQLSVPYDTKQEQKGLMGIWRVARSTRLQYLAMRSFLIFNCASSDNKFPSEAAGVKERFPIPAPEPGLDRNGAEFTCKLSLQSPWMKGKSYASGSHLKRHIKEGPTPTATRARTRSPPPPGRGRVLDTASHFYPQVTYPPKWASSFRMMYVRRYQVDTSVPQLTSGKRSEGEVV